MCLQTCGSRLQRQGCRRHGGLGLPGPEWAAPPPQGRAQGARTGMRRKSVDAQGRPHAPSPPASGPPRRQSGGSVPVQRCHSSKGLVRGRMWHPRDRGCTGVEGASGPAGHPGSGCWRLWAPGKPDGGYWGVCRRPASLSPTAAPPGSPAGCGAGAHERAQLNQHAASDIWTQFCSASKQDTA